MIKIGIDARVLQTSHRYRGIGIYAYNLIQNIARLDSINKYVFFSQGNNEGLKKIKFPQKFHYQEKSIRNAKDPSRYNWYLDQFFLPKAIKRNKVQIVHFLDQLSAPLIKTVKTIITVNDLMQFHGQKSSWKNRIKIKPIVSADKIIAISEYTKKEIIKHFPIQKNKIKVIYDGYDENYFCPAKSPMIQKKFRNKILGSEAKRYLFYSGSFEDHEPRKNVDFLLNILQELDQKNSKEISLIFSGKEGKESRRLQEKAAKLSLQDRIIFTGFLKKEELVRCYQSAEALVFPSFCEGFGLPPLEAMACGCPVISSNTSSLPEVVGGAGILLDPNDINSWVKNIKKILEDKTFAKALIKKGLIQAKIFSWDKCARETVNVYKEAYNGKN